VISGLGASEACRFFGGDLLYVDQRGRRVVADVEGAGHYSVEGEATVEVDDSPGALKGTFSCVLSVFAEPGAARVAVATGRAQPPEGRQLTAEGMYLGAGWVVEASDGVVVDERREKMVPIEGFPIPFFREARSHGKMKIIEAAPPEMRLLQRLSIGDPASLNAVDLQVQNMSEPSAFSSRFSDGTEHEAMVASHLNRARWRCDLPPNLKGLILRKVYDRFHGRQRARVLVNDAPIGIWYEPLEDRQRRWAVAQFGIPASVLPATGEVELAIDPPAGTALWSVSDLEVWALL
jgi:hypothetical protein